YFGPKLQERLKEALHAKVEGTCTGRFGYVITVTEIVSMGKGRIEENIGDVVFDVRYKAIVFKPFTGEVLDAEVVSVSEIGFSCTVGPLNVFVPHQRLGDFSFDADAAPQCWTSPDSRHVIKVDSEVRIKIQAVNEHANDIFCIGTISEDFLGVI
ncbi:DNA-directed RNA polymerase II subunit rpb7, partial [Thecamonas trahens ATCC 50062]